MTIGIVGSSGYISSYLLKRLINEKYIDLIVKIDKSLDADIFLDLEHPEKFDYEKLSGIDYLIFTAAISGPDKCATDFEFCWNINVNGTKFFIREAIKRNCKVVFFSSDAVFGDIAGHIYDEDSETNALTPYGRMKKAIEDEFKYTSSFKAIRLSYVASAKDRFISYCISCINNNDIADVFHPFYRNVIVVSDVVNVIVWLINHWDDFKPWVLNIAGKELVSRVRMADELNRHLEGKLNYTISMPNDDFYNNRPKITQMRSKYLYKYNIIEDNTFTEKIRQELKSIK